MAFLRDESGKVFLAKRPHGKQFGGLWEFPGGKLEEGELPEQAIVRELREELAIEVEAIAVHRPYTYDGNDRYTHFYPISCRQIAGEITLLEHTESVFCDVEQIGRLPLAPPDYEAVSILIEFETLIDGY